MKARVHVERIYVGSASIEVEGATEEEILTNAKNRIGELHLNLDMDPEADVAVIEEILPPTV